jgi:hypothetical protein
MTPSPTTVVLLVAGVALVTWATVRLAKRRVRSASATVPYYARTATARPERRLERHPTGRGPRDVRCPAAPAGRAYPGPHPRISSRRPSR